MATNPLTTSKAIKNNYIRYLSTVFHLNDKDLQEQFINILKQDDKFVKGPIVEATPFFRTSISIRELTDEKVLSNLFKGLDKSTFDIDRKLYVHQEKAIRKVVTYNRNIVVATGTGSGKTETFLIPILNHLLKELESNTLCPGVRALLLYPMNALANDQMERIRSLLRDFPNITFGRYTGETEKDLNIALEKYEKQYNRKPLKNELISRKQMWNTPPNILLTNYAMLEYLLLRPDDSVFFDDSKYAKYWKFIILDEAHTYKGAKGIEMSMLLRRLKERINRHSQSKLTCIATSATLGKGREEYKAISEFASQLFGENFEWSDNIPEKQDIIESEKIPLRLSSESWGKPDSELYKKWELIVANTNEDSRIALLEKTGLVYGVPKDILKKARINCNKDWRVFLYEVLKGDRTVQSVQEELQNKPQHLTAFAEKLFEGHENRNELLIALVNLANMARQNNDTPQLLPARYHLFVRAVEGMYLALKPQKQIFLERYRTNRVKDKEYPVYEIAACSQCGSLYIVGNIIDEQNGSYLIQGSDIGNHPDYFLLESEHKELTEIDEDEEVMLSQNTVQSGKYEEFILCASCGSINKARIVGKKCECSETSYFHLVKVQKGKDGNAYKCPACGKCNPKGIIWKFLTGSEASASVLCNALYQEIEPKIIEKRSVIVDEDDEWAPVNHTKESKIESRKLLVFSDSRQDAAFFAPYFQRTYNQILHRSLILKTLVDNKEDVINNKWRLQDLVGPVIKVAEEAGLLKGMSLQEKKGEIWKWIMYELIAFDRRNSLEGLGLLGFELSKPDGWGPPRYLLTGKWSLTADEVWTLYKILFDSLRVKGVVSFPDYVSPTDEFFEPRNKEFYFRTQTPDSKKGILSWNTNTLNSRLDYLIKLSKKIGNDLTNDDCILTLKNILDKDIMRNTVWQNHIREVTLPGEGVLFKLNYNIWDIRATLLDNYITWYRCNKCNTITLNNIKNICPNYKCTGELVPCDPLKSNENNHYLNLYKNLKPIGMKCEEHTAQLRSEAASDLQNKFISGEVNILSCSTTFEMGVDVGELETVFMRNVPPSAANYIQRAGRAGRRADSTAFVLTFAQRRSHDIAHYNNPEMMITGKISAPYFKVENTKILRRHIFSVAIAKFWKENKDYFGNVENFFLNNCGYGIDKIKEFLKSKPYDLLNSIKTIIPEYLWNTLGIMDWGWTDYLLNDNYGVLTKAHNEIVEDLNELEILRKKLFEERKDIRHLDRLIKTIREKDLIGYLSSKNVLPKYGFPVDVVELELAHHGEEAKRLQLERDLKIAISEYAPGGQVIAGGKLWKSQYIKRLMRMEWESFKYAICDYCNNYYRVRLELADNFSKTCPVCGNTFGRNNGIFIIPAFGFISDDKKPEDPRDKKPERTYATRVYYSGEAVEEESQTVLLNNETIILTPAANGKLSVINNGKGGGFSICTKCGYTVLSGTRISRPHRGPRGQECNGSFRSHVSLGHEFETDILKIEFRNKRDKNIGFWLSILYAIIEGACLGLGIERSDLDGCLYPVDRNISNFALIVYDDVPGGAGHVRRIANKDNILIALKTALNKLQSCECGGEDGNTSCYGCLRNYGNQFYHELLDRSIAIEFLKEILCGL